MKKSLGAGSMAPAVPLWIIGSYGQNNQANAAAAAWVGICCSKPPEVAVSFRKVTNSYENIMERKAFTVNIPDEKHLVEADYCGIVSGHDHDKLAEAALTQVKSELVDAPYIEEFPFILECRVVKINDLGLHTQFIGEVVDIKVDEAVLDDHGHPAVDKIKPFFFVPGASRYYGVGKPVGQAFSSGKQISD
jgi:flavin reductase (DIM6/NTAB) family NADH-FMN oxidoreductase RutF